jgi:hypothetical protein
LAGFRELAGSAAAVAVAATLAAGEAFAASVGEALAPDSESLPQPARPAVIASVATAITANPAFFHLAIFFLSSLICPTLC